MAPVFRNLAPAKPGLPNNQKDLRATIAVPRLPTSPLLLLCKTRVLHFLSIFPIQLGIVRIRFENSGQVT